MFHVGQKVVCIADFTPLMGEYWATELCVEFPVKDQVYTVRRRVQRPGPLAEYGIMLVEILNQPTLLDKAGVGGVIPRDQCLPPDEMAFDSRDFRPLISAERFAVTSERSPETV